MFLRQGGRHRLGMTGFSWTAAVPRAAVALSGRPVATLPARGRRLLFFFFFFSTGDMNQRRASITPHRDSFVPSPLPASPRTPSEGSDEGAGELLTSLK